MSRHLSAALVALSLVATTLAAAPQPTPITLVPGQFHPLPATANARYESSAPRTAQVLPNNTLVALQPGAARITATSPGAPVTEYLITIEHKELPTTDPATLQQFPDNRRFEINGRRCYGSELNGQRAVDPAERQNTRSNRVINPTPLRPDRHLEWEVQPGAQIYDGAGLLLGTVAPELKLPDRAVPTCKFNFGMSKVIAGRLHLYAFSVAIQPAADFAPTIDPNELTNGTVRTSAWLPVEHVVDAKTLLDRIGLGKPTLPRLPLEDRRYRVTGGDPTAYLTPHGELGIVKAVNGPVPSHYLRRPTHTINLIYSVPGFGLGGQNLDSFLLSNNLTFRPAQGAKQFVQLTYYPKSHPQAGQPSPKTMTFLYGALEPKNHPPVYGWIALEALAPQP